MNKHAKYPPVVPAPDAAAKARALPLRTWWAAEDEPCYEIPEGSGRRWPHREAVRLGLVTEVAHER